MKKMFLFVAVAATSLGLYSFIPATKKLADTYTVEATSSKVNFVGNKKSGYHPGTIGIKSGSLTVDAGKLTGGKFTFDIAGLTINDGAKDGLEKHLKAADVFDAAKYPEATFEITNVTYADAANVEVAGNLTVKDKTVPVKFPVVIRNADGKKFFGQAFFTLNASLLPIQQVAAPDVQISVYLFANK